MTIHTAISTEERLLAIWQDLFAMPSVGPGDNFFVLGGYSLLAGRLAVRVHEEFGVELSPHQLFETPTVAQMAVCIEERITPERDVVGHRSQLVPLQPRGTRSPFFCVYLINGTVFVYHALAQLLGPDQPVYGVEAQGVAGEEQPLTTMADMVVRCVDQIRSLQPHGPYQLGGYSFSGLLAVEIARALEADGEQVALLALFDTWLPYHPTLPRRISRLRQQMKQKELRLRVRLRPFTYHASRLLSLPAQEKVPYLREKIGVVGRRWVDKRHHIDRRPMRAGDELEAIARLNLVQAGAVTAASSYTVEPYVGRITYFQSEVPHWTVWFDQPKAWASLARGGFDLHRVPGAHDRILHEPNVEVLAGTLRTCLEKGHQAGQPEPARAQSG